jgi:hypothetical protein
METKKRFFLISLLISALVLFPIALFGQGQGREMPGPITANSPPVAQPLVPEGVFAVALVKALKIGQTQNEAEAESMLSAIGIEPKNGWIANYPVTPDIIGEIEETVAMAADAKRLEMGKDQAQKAVENLVAQLGSNVMPGPSSPSAPAIPGGGTVNATIYKYIDKSGVAHFTDRYESIPNEYRDQIKTIQEEVQAQPFMGATDEAAETPPSNHYSANPNPEVINNYYHNDGPPVVTYYAPPWPYYYMYVWVPYPFWCSRFFFPGFFILHDFHRTVIVDKRVFVVTNHVVNAKTKTVFRVDPVTKKPGRKVGVNRFSSPQPFSTPSTQASARAIVAISQQRAHSIRFTTEPGIRNGAPSTPLSRPQPQVSSNRGANYPMKKPPTITNRRTATNSAASGSSAMAGKPPFRPGIGEKLNEGNLQKSLPGEVRSFRQPVKPNEKAVPSPATNSRSRYRPSPPVIISSPRVEQRESLIPVPGNTGNRNDRNVERPQTAGSRTFNLPATNRGSFDATPAGRVFSPPSASQNRVIPAPAIRGSSSFEESRGGIGGSIGRSLFRGR